MSSELRFKVSKKIKVLRNKAKLTQEQLADQAGIDYKYLQKIESKDPSNISLKTIEKIAHAFRINPSKLLKD